MAGPFGHIQNLIYWIDYKIPKLIDIIHSSVDDIKKRRNHGRHSEWATGLDNPRFEWWHGKGIKRPGR
jgi:hypothetical protein